GKVSKPPEVRAKFPSPGRVRKSPALAVVRTFTSGASDGHGPAGDRQPDAGVPARRPPRRRPRRLCGHPARAGRARPRPPWPGPAGGRRADARPAYDRARTDLVLLDPRGGGREGVRLRPSRAIPTPSPRTATLT